MTYPLKIDGWNMNFPFKMLPFSGTFIHFIHFSRNDQVLNFLSPWKVWNPWQELILMPSWVRWPWWWLVRVKGWLGEYLENIGFRSMFLGNWMLVLGVSSWWKWTATEFSRCFFFMVDLDPQGKYTTHWASGIGCVWGVAQMSYRWIAAPMCDAMGSDGSRRDMFPMAALLKAGIKASLWKYSPGGRSGPLNKIVDFGKDHYFSRNL